MRAAYHLSVLRCSLEGVTNVPALTYRFSSILGTASLTVFQEEPACPQHVSAGLAGWMTTCRKQMLVAMELERKTDFDSPLRCPHKYMGP